MFKIMALFLFTMMVQDLKYRNKPSQECLYGWYPGGNEPARSDPKEIYVNLGSRPPRDQSYVESGILYQYHQSMKPSDRDYKPKQTPEEALRPPWSLHNKPIQNTEDNIEELEDAERTKTPFKGKNIPTHRVVLKIPTPQLFSLFDAESDRKSNEDNETIVKELDNMSNYSENLGETTLTRPKTSTSIRSIANTPDRLSRLSHLTQPPEPDLQSEVDSSSEKNYQENETKSKANEVNCEKKMSIVNNKYVKIPYHYKVIEVNNVGKKPILGPHEDDSPKENSRFRNSRFKKSTRPKTSLSLMGRNHSAHSKPPRPETAFNNKKYPPKSPEPSYTYNDYQKELQKLNEFRPNSQQQQQQQQQQILFADKFSQNLNIQPLSYSTEPCENADQQVFFIKKTPTPTPPPTQPQQQQQQTQIIEKDEVRLVEGHWKDQLINRGRYLQKRPKYNVKIDVEKLKQELPAPDVHYNASETYFYNTIPFKRSTFTINPHFISENLNVKKINLTARPLSSSSNNVSPTNAAPARTRRGDLAFVY